MKYRRLVIITLAGLIAACTSSPEKEQSGTTVEDRSGDTGSGSDSATGTRSYGTGADTRSAMEQLNDPAGRLADRTIYFDYDSSDVDAEYRSIVEAHGTFLAANPDITVSLEGHADERGSREYNLALGERRAQAVKRQMVVLGASASQIRTTSYGEERPVVDGHTEAAWSQNRRVEIIY